jgi:hypothetical protein
VIVALAVIAVLCVYFWKRRKRSRPLAIESDAPETCAVGADESKGI